MAHGIRELTPSDRAEMGKKVRSSWHLFMRFEVRNRYRFETALSSSLTSLQLAGLRGKVTTIDAPTTVVRVLLTQSQIRDPDPGGGGVEGEGG